MNLLEHYIIEIISEGEPIESKIYVEGRKSGDIEEPFINAVVKVDCYGCIETKRVLYPLSVWNKIKEQGYFHA